MTERLEEIKKRLEAATPGPWDFSGYCQIDGAIHFGTIGPTGSTGINFTDTTSCLKLVGDISCRSDADVDAVANASLMANAPADLSYLLEEVGRLTKALRDCQTKMYYIGNLSHNAWRDPATIVEVCKRIEEYANTGHALSVEALAASQEAK